MKDEDLEDFAQKVNVVMDRSLPVMRRYLKKVADKNFDNIHEKYGFIIWAAVNFLGNLTLMAAKNNPEVLALHGEKVIKNVRTWFEKMETKLINEKEMH